MCDPVTATALALSASGSYLEQREADKNAKRMQNAKNDVFEAEQIRQQQFADEAGGAFTENVNKQGRDAFDEQQSSEADRFMQAFTERRVQPDYNTGLRPNTPKNVVLANQAASNEATTEADRDAGNLAELTGYSGAMFNQGLDNNEFARLFGKISNEARGQSRLLPLRMNSAATNSQKAPSMFPKLLKAGGQALSLYSAGSGTGNFLDAPTSVTPQAGQMGPIMGAKPGLFTKTKNAFGNLGGGF